MTFTDPCRCFAWPADNPPPKLTPGQPIGGPRPSPLLMVTLQTWDPGPHLWRAGHNKPRAGHEGHSGARSAETAPAGPLSPGMHSFPTHCPSFQRRQEIRKCSPTTMDIVGCLVLQALAARNHVRECQQHTLCGKNKPEDLLRLGLKSAQHLLNTILVLPPGQHVMASVRSPQRSAWHQSRPKQ